MIRRLIAAAAAVAILAGCGGTPSHRDGPRAPVTFTTTGAATFATTGAATFTTTGAPVLTATPAWTIGPEATP